MDMKENKGHEGEQGTGRRTRDREENKGQER